MSETTNTATIEPLVPIFIGQQTVMTKEEALKIFPTLQKGYELSLRSLEEITEVTKENKEEIVAKLATNKKYYDKIKTTRMPLTQWLDQMKEAVMMYERPSDYNDKKSLYSQKRALVEAYDQQQLEAANAAKKKAEEEKRIALYKAELKAKVQQQLVKMLSDRKQSVIASMAKWEAALTSENIDENEKRLIAQKPALKKEEYDKCFVIQYQKQSMVPPDLTYTDTDNDQIHTDFFAIMKVDEPYEKYNEQYIQAIAPIINAVRARIPEIKKALNDKDAEARRQQEIQQRAQQEQQAVQQETEAKMDEVANQKDMNIMEANFVEQATVQDLASGPTKKIIRLQEGNVVKPFLEIVGHCLASPKFNLYKKGKEYTPGVEWFMKFFSANCADKEVKGLEITEAAKTTIRS